MKVRIATVQYMLRPVTGWSDFEQQVQFTLRAASEYRPNFVLLPEILTTQLMSCLPRGDVRSAVRAIENQVYVVMASTVGALPVEGLGLHYGQASIITPSDFPFSRDGIAAEGVANSEQIVIADLDLELLVENRISGTTIPLYDKREDVYNAPVAMVRTNPLPQKARA